MDLINWQKVDEKKEAHTSNHVLLSHDLHALYIDIDID